MFVHCPSCRSQSPDESRHAFDGTLTFFKDWPRRLMAGPARFHILPTNREPFLELFQHVHRLHCL
jgi:hypothetical protein